MYFCSRAQRVWVCVKSAASVPLDIIATLYCKNTSCSQISYTYSWPSQLLLAELQLTPMQIRKSSLTMKTQFCSKCTECHRHGFERVWMLHYKVLWACFGMSCWCTSLRISQHLLSLFLTTLVEWLKEWQDLWVHRFCPDWNTAATIVWIALKFPWSHDFSSSATSRSNIWLICWSISTPTTCQVTQSDIHSWFLDTIWLLKFDSTFYLASSSDQSKLMNIAIITC